MNKPRLPTLIVEVTQACNHACPHCYNYWQHPHCHPAPKREVPDLRPLLNLVLDQVNCSHVTLTGGEPLMREDLPEVVSFLHARHVDVTLITNGRLLNDQLAADLIGRGVGLFELPLLSWRRAIHDRLSGAAGAFDASVAALAHVRFHRGRAIAVFVITRQNVSDLYDTIQLACGFGAQGVMLNRFNPGGRGVAHMDELMPTVAELKLALDAAESAAQAFQMPVSCSIPIQPCLIDASQYRHLSFGFCAAGSDRAYYTLDAWGNVRPCNHTPTILGNAWKHRFADLMDSPRLHDFVAAIPPLCADCQLRSQCQGGCKAAAEVCFGQLTAEEPFLQRNRRPAASIQTSKQSLLIPQPEH